MSNLLWVIQTDLDRIENQREQEQLIDALERLECRHQRVTVSNYETDPVIDYDGPIVVHGSIMLSKIANRKGWSPGSDFNENFSYSAWGEKLRPHLLNSDAVFTTLAHTPPFTEFFIRPVSDEKTFNGRLLRRDEYLDWRSRLLLSGTPIETPIVYASAKRVPQEHRHYCVGRDVITSSRYKLDGVVNISAQVDQYIVDYVRELIQEWQPGELFVVDTFVDGDRVGVVEIGCLTHAGLYAADIQKIVFAIECRYALVSGSSSHILGAHEYLDF